MTLRKTIIVIIALLGIAPSAQAITHYAVAKGPTPVLNVPDFRAVFGGNDGQTLHANNCGLIKEVEYIALPGTVFTIHAQQKSGTHFVYNVTIDNYPKGPGENYYIDSRFVEKIAQKPAAAPVTLPPPNTVLKNLQATEGNIYIWGGNVKGGVPDLERYYPPKSTAAQSPDIEKRWTLNGYDCSGILYEATGGVTPRNTSGLVALGQAVPIAGMSAKKIANQLKPLDLIVWKGHVMVVFDKTHLIESRADYDDTLDGCQEGGVRIRKTVDVLKQTLKNRIPVNNYDDPVGPNQKKFVVRRWHPEAS